MIVPNVATPAQRNNATIPIDVKEVLSSLPRGMAVAPTTNAAPAPKSRQAAMTEARRHPETVICITARYTK
jgi:hypothetical protein